MAIAFSKTETAIRALVDVIHEALRAEDFPLPTRNDTAIGVLEAIDGGDGGRINIFDGDQVSREEMIGADDPDTLGFDIVHAPQFDLIVVANDPNDRDTKFDHALVLIDDALAADRSLGGVVDHCVIENIQRSDLVTDGIASVKAAVVTIHLTFVSSRPF